MNKADKGHPAQHRCHCAASLHGQTSLAPRQPVAMGDGAVPTALPPRSWSRSPPQLPTWCLGLCFTSFQQAGSNLREEWEAQPAPGEGCCCSSGKAGLGAASPMPPCPHRRAPTPFPCASSAACLTTGKPGAPSHLEFKNETSERAPCSFKKPKQIAPKSKHLRGLAQSAATPEAESARGGSSTRQLQGRREERHKELRAGWKPLNSTLPHKKGGTALSLTATFADKGRLQAY